MKNIILTGLFVVLFCFSPDLRAQQFNSDNYLTMPHGTGTFVLTTGERNSGMVSSFALIKNFEFFVQAFLFRDIRVDDYAQHFNTTVYAKYMFWVNEANTGGAAVFLGMGQSPGSFTQDGYSPLHKNYWTALPITIPFFNNTISWDIMPGAMVDLDYGNNKETAWGFTYSTRVAVYNVIPKTAIVGEVYGTEGQAYSKPEYKVGLRWEPNSFIVPAISYGGSFDGSLGAGFEIGVVIFSPPFLKKDYIKNNKIEY
ncbi:MAG: hypothetical protein WBN19_09225 [Lutimonas sp.]